MERVVHWWVDGYDRVPDSVLMQVVSTYKPQGEKFFWQIDMLKPLAHQPQDPGWLEVAVLEQKCVTFELLHQQYRSSHWVARSEEPLSHCWQTLRDKLVDYSVRLPELNLDSKYWDSLAAVARELGHGQFETQAKAAQRYNLVALREASQALEKALQPLRTIRIVAWRFGVPDWGGRVQAWNYPRRKLRELKLPLTEPGRTFREGHKALVTEKEIGEALRSARDKLLFPVVAGWVQEDGRMLATLSGHQIPQAPHDMQPYQLDRPYVAWRRGMPKAGPGAPLSPGDDRFLVGLHWLVKSGRLQELSQLTQHNQAMVLQSFEDAGIWQEYDRIRSVDSGAQKPAGFGTLKPTRKALPVTAIFGGQSLILWDWARQERRRQTSTMTEMSMCPSCSKQWSRKRGEHRRKPCDNCVGAAAKRVRRFRERQAAILKPGLHPSPGHSIAEE